MKNKPTKRDIMIVEDFVKKTTKSMMNENSSYYLNNLNKIVVDGEYPASFKFISNGTQTNNLNLNQESAKVLINWLKANFKKLPAGN